MKEISEYHELLKCDGEIITIHGTYLKYDPMPERKSAYKLYLSAILLSDQIKPTIFLELPRNINEQNNLHKKKVRITGTFYLKQPTLSGDPEYASKMKGSWIFQISSIEEIQR